MKAPSNVNCFVFKSSTVKAPSNVPLRRNVIQPKNDAMESASVMTRLMNSTAQVQIAN